MNVPSIRMIATDLDGTLLGRGGRLLPENARALRRAADAGIALAICSGRLPAVCSRIACDMGIADACTVIGLNGTQIVARPFGEAIAYSAFAPETAAACWAVLQRAGAPTTLYGPDSVFTNQPFPTPADRARYEASFANAGVTADIAPDAVARGLRGDALKFLAKFPGGAAQEAAVREGLRGIPGTALTASRPGRIEIVQAGCSKAAALSRVAASLGIAPQEVMAFGDYDNDLDMLAWAGLGIAMQNASPEAKAAARLITGTNENAGVAKAVLAYLDGTLGGG